MTDFKFLWSCNARLEQTIECLESARRVLNHPDGTRVDFNLTLLVVGYLAQRTRGCSSTGMLCRILEQTQFSDPDSWVLEFTRELEQVQCLPERAPELLHLHQAGGSIQGFDIPSLLAALKSKRDFLDTVVDSVLTHEITRKENLSNGRFVWEFWLTLEALRNSIDELERINLSPKATHHQVVRAGWLCNFWLQRAKRFQGIRLERIASSYAVKGSPNMGLLSPSFWRVDFPKFLDEIEFHNPNESITTLTRALEAWDRVRYEIIYDAPTSDPLDEASNAELLSETESSVAVKEKPEKRKKSTSRGEATMKIVAALTKHHDYDTGSCLNLSPIGVNELARLAQVSPSTVWSFLNRQFSDGRADGHTKYRAMCSDPKNLAASLRLMNGEYSPSLLFGTKPPGDGDYEDQE